MEAEGHVGGSELQLAELEDGKLGTAEATLYLCPLVQGLSQGRSLVGHGPHSQPPGGSQMEGVVGGTLRKSW